MTKRFNIALIAVALLLVLVAIAPVSAAPYTVRTAIMQGATVYFGEAGLNLTPAIANGTYYFPYNQAGVITQTPLADPTSGLSNYMAGDREAAVIGWWASAAQLQTTSATKTINLANGFQNRSFQVPSADSGMGAVGNWYLVNQTTGYADTPALLVMADPTLNIQVWDIGNSNQVNNVDVSGKTVPQGEWLGFKIITNQIDALAPLRRNVSAASGSIGDLPTETYYTYDGYVDITVKDPNGATLTGLLNASTGNGGVANSILQLNVSHQGIVSQPNGWIWGVTNSTQNPQFMNSIIGAPLESLRFMNWTTDATDTNGQYAYPPGTYTIYATSKLNGVNDNYKLGGADYTLKTVSPTVTVTLSSDTVKIEANKDSVVRSKAFAVTITGKPNTVYHMWVKGTSTMTGRYDDQPPMIKANQLGVTTDRNLYNGGVAVGPLAPGTVSNALLISSNGPGGNGDAVIDSTTNVLVTTGASGYPASYAGNYQYDNGNGNTVWGDVAHGALFQETVNGVRTNVNTYDLLGNGTFCYANVSTSATTATRTVEWTTTNWTKAQKYTIRVEQRFPLYSAYNAQVNANNAAINVKSDEVDVKVEKGAVTIVAAGDQSYYLGEEIKFSGTNTESYKTYLFIKGPNLPDQGGQISTVNPRANPVNDGVPGDFRMVDVNADNTWSWKWGTSTVALDAGTYTIYAVSQPRNAANNNLAQAAYGTVSIIIKKPFVSATASQSTVAQGDRVYITGTAEGQPTAVKIWILGKNYPANVNQIATQSVNTDASFKYEVTQGTTRTMYPGQYFVVVQHPMQNNVFDIDLCTDTLNAVQVKVCNAQQTTTAPLWSSATHSIFTILGQSSLQGSDAAEALVQGINSPNVDDTYTKLQFLVEVPVIRIDPIGDKRVGDKFTITAQTNLAVDDEVLVQVYSSSFKPTQKSQSGEFSGATGTVKVAKGDSGMNKISFDVDTSTFKPDEYIVQETAVIQVATGTALFNVLEGQAPVATTVAPVTTVATPVATTVATTVATPVPTTTPKPSPGYGALIALIGLGAVAFIVVRRH